jgi:hypothetical protein
MNFLQATREVIVARTFQTHIRAVDVLRVHHDPVRRILIQPLVVQYDKTSDACAIPGDPSSSSDWAQYRVTEKIPWFGLVSNDCWFKKTPDGVLVHVEAPFWGLSMRTAFKVEDVEGGVRMEETTRLQLNRLLMPFVVGQLTSEHEKMLAASLEEAVKDVGPETRA